MPKLRTPTPGRVPRRQLMSRIVMFIVLSWLGPVQPTVFARLNVIQLTPGDLATSPCTVVCAPVDEGRQFRFSCQVTPSTNLAYAATLRIYKGPELVSICPAEKARDGEKFRCEFTVAPKYCKDSRFVFTIYDPQRPAGTQYWFYLGDFAPVRPSGTKVSAASEEQGVQLRFRRIGAKPLRKAQPKPNWKLAKLIRIEARGTEVHLYVDPSTQDDGRMGEVHAFLNDGRESYQLGEISNYGVEDVTVKEFALGKRKAWQIGGALGAAGDCLAVFAFDGRRWGSYLNASWNRTEMIDLDGDRIPEVVGRFGAAADVTLYRWAVDDFESVDIAKALGTDYAQLFTAGDEWVFEAGKLAGEEKADIRYFRYRGGRLVPLNSAPQQQGRTYF